DERGGALGRAPRRLSAHRARDRAAAPPARARRERGVSPPLGPLPLRAGGHGVGRPCLAGAPGGRVSGWLPARRAPLPRGRARRLRPAAPRPLLGRGADHAPLLPVGGPARTDRAPARGARG